VPVKPTFPAAAKKQTDAGAVAFVEYYLDALDYAWSAPDDKILVGLSTSDCKFCVNVQKRAEKAAEEGTKSTGRVLVARDVFIVSKPAKFWLVACDVESDAVDYVNSSGTVVDGQPKKSGQWAAKVVWSDGWRVQQLGSR
jgi:hypothetical protein